MLAKDFKTRQFMDWIKANGGAIDKLTNEWEVLRYKLSGEIFVIYKNKRGDLTISEESRLHHQAFLGGAPASIVARIQSKPRERIINSLLIRDGECCALCGYFLEDDITLEHWLAIDAGGSNDPRNLGLVHALCNNILGSLPIIRKIELRDRILRAASELPPWVRVNVTELREAA